MKRNKNIFQSMSSLIDLHARLEKFKIDFSDNILKASDERYHAIENLLKIIERQCDFFTCISSDNIETCRKLHKFIFKFYQQIVHDCYVVDPMI